MQLRLVGIGGCLLAVPAKDARSLLRGAEGGGGLMQEVWGGLVCALGARGGPVSSGTCGTFCMPFLHKTARKVRSWNIKCTVYSACW